MSLPIALQFFTLWNEAEADFLGTLEKTAEIGYEGIEFATFKDIPADTLRSAMDRFGIKAAGSHTNKEALANKLEAVMEYNLTIGNKYVVCPYDEYKSMEDIAAAARFYNSVGRKLKDKGMQLVYHNHSHEFAKFDGKYVLDILYSLTDPELLKAEIDTYWVKYGGEDPVGYVKKMSGRCPLVHMKDMSPDRGMTEVGEGIIDMKGLVRASEKAGAEWLIVEQDVCKRSPLESVRISFDNLKKIV